MMKTYCKTLAAVAVMSTLAACGPHQTVDWYASHAPERAEKVKWCQDDAARQADADCLNAIKADELARFSPATPRLQFQVPGTGPGSSAAAASTAPAPAQSGQPMQFHFTPHPASAGGK